MPQAKGRRALLAATLCACLAAGTGAQQGDGAVPALAYDAQTRGPVPIPPSERQLQTVVAEPWFKVSDEGLVLEGPAFDQRRRPVLLRRVRTSLAIKPGTDDLYVVTSDGKGGQGATIFHARAFAKALPLHSHQ